MPSRGIQDILYTKKKLLGKELILRDHNTIGTNSRIKYIGKRKAYFFLTKQVEEHFYENLNLSKRNIPTEVLVSVKPPFWIKWDLGYTKFGN